MALQRVEDDRYKQSFCGRRRLFWVKLGPRAASELGPFIPQQQTCSDCGGMSVSCHERTHALQQTPASFDYFVGADECRGLELHVEIGGGPQV
jgi:hypothetical protein